VQNRKYHKTKKEFEKIIKHKIKKAFRKNKNWK